MDRAHVDRRFRKHEQQKRQRNVMPENTNAHYPSLLLLTFFTTIQLPVAVVFVFTTDPIARFGSVALVPFYWPYGGVYMLGDPVFLRNRPRLGPRRLQPLWRN